MGCPVNYGRANDQSFGGKKLKEDLNSYSPLSPNKFHKDRVLNMKNEMVKSQEHIYGSAHSPGVEKTILTILPPNMD